MKLTREILEHLAPAARADIERQLGRAVVGPPVPGMRKPRARRGSGETGLVKAIRAYLSLRGIRTERRNTGILRNPAGQPIKFGQTGAADLSATLPGGRRLEIEVKNAVRKLTDGQRTWLLEQHRAGAVVLVVRPADWQAQCDAVLAGGPMPPETARELGL